MNDDEFENKLRAVTRSLHRPDPTPSWKADILTRANYEASATPVSHTLPPRWLLVTWAAAWLVIALLGLTTPQPDDRHLGVDLAAADSTKGSGSGSVLDSSPQTLIAFDNRLHLNNDLP